MANILLTGGTGKTGRRIAPRLAEAGHDVRLASRRGADARALRGIRFDWNDPSTFDAALANREAVYLVAPTDAPESLRAMQPFLDRALAIGIRRYVLLSASSLPKRGPMMGAVHAYLEEHAPEWAVLRPTWFMQNFSEQQHLPTIRDERAIFSATGEGRVPFIDVEDIAAVAVEALTRDVSFNRDLVLTGPRALSYGDVAEIVGAAIGAGVRHVNLSEGALVERFGAAGMHPDYAAILAGMDIWIASGAEDRLSPDVEAVTGRPPNDFVAYAGRVRDAWL
ncbi:oxidoreductase [Kaistia sp. 32K]|uniref:ergot alkaloid biosynthesis protein n=1 Tax=Kaistia sp. 32K TaxID=2795690 RepID=UPI001937E99D|nr:ergot alkaloid biosynthesis protein [Kaistia sp. 32K]BCP53967.1 oxidoreductase [Kaistia sp. 32K]